MTSHWKYLMIAVFALAVAACHRGADDPAHSAQTQTIPPAAPQPAPNTGDSEMTQTVDVEDSRSEAEGTATAAPPAKPTNKKAPAPVKKRK